MSSLLAEQGKIMAEQDELIEELDAWVEARREIAQAISLEIVRHNEMLSDVERHVDEANSHVNSGIKQTKKVMKTDSGCCNLL